MFVAIKTAKRLLEFYSFTLIIKQLVTKYFEKNELGKISYMGCK